MKGKSIAKLVAIIVVIAIFAYLAVFGANIGDYKILPIKDTIKLGLDLKGGVFVILEASEEDGSVDAQTMDKAVETVRGRVDQLGVSEPIIVAEGENRVRVELPGVDNPEEAIKIIGQTALLEFKDPNGEVVLTGADVVDAQAGYYDAQTGTEYQVALELSKEGADKFAKATEEFLHQVISIELDGNVISQPIVQSVITDGKASITHMESLDAANNLAILLRSGALPVALKEVQTSTIGPTLGQDSLNRSLKAGVLGIIVILLYMLVLYRLPGAIADIALILYTLLVLVILTSIGAVLTLPGIAGLILSIGMAVDANVIIFERIKEELKTGKSVRTSIEAGFKRAFRTILDSNVTTLIAAAALYYFGSGNIRGFALTLGIGILVSMLTAIVFTRIMLKICANLTSNPALFGAKGGAQNE